MGSGDSWAESFDKEQAAQTAYARSMEHRRVAEKDVPRYEAEGWRKLYRVKRAYANGSTVIEYEMVKRV